MHDIERKLIALAREELRAKKCPSHLTYLVAILWLVQKPKHRGTRKQIRGISPKGRRRFRKHNFLKKGEKENVTPLIFRNLVLHNFINPCTLPATNALLHTLHMTLSVDIRMLNGGNPFLPESHIALLHFVTRLLESCESSFLKEEALWPTLGKASDLMSTLEMHDNCPRATQEALHKAFQAFGRHLKAFAKDKPEMQITLETIREVVLEETQEAFTSGKQIQPSTAFLNLVQTKKEKGSENPTLDTLLGLLQEDTEDTHALEDD